MHVYYICIIWYVSYLYLYVTDKGQNQQLFDFWSLTTFQSRPKHMQLLDVQVYIYIYADIYTVHTIWLFNSLPWKITMLFISKPW